ncbi:MAG: apolipoprotein N-acyltransferase [Nitrospinota bacterium]
MRVQDFASAAVTGGLLALTFPRFDLEPLAWVALVPLLLALDGKAPAQSFLLGLVAGIVHYGVTLSWVVNTLVSYGRLPPLTAWAVLFLLVTYMAAYLGLFGWGLALIARASPQRRWLLAPPLWVALELLRAHALTGFPWASLGYSQALSLPAIQVAEITGVYGVSFALVALNASLWHLIRYPGYRQWRVLAVGVAVVGLTVGYGFARLWDLQRQRARPWLPVALTQGNIDQSRKWDEAYRQETLRIYRELSLRAAREASEGGAPVPPLVVWPESAAPFLFEREPALAEQMARIARESGAYLLFGAPAVGRRNGQRRLLNSAYLLSPTGERLGRYDKLHLVPFGEYVPLGRFLPFVRKLVVGVADFAEGTDYTLFRAPGGRFGVLICFEVIFPQIARRFAQGGAEFLVNITNDAWFGRSAASYQHIAMVAFRAVENRLPVVRAANTGITAFIDPTGRIRGATELFRRTHVVGRIRPRRSPPTFYGRYGDLFAYACVLLVVVALVGGFRRGRPRVWYY